MVIEFAIGLGEGFGHIFAYLNKELRNKILEDVGNENGGASDIRDDNYRRNGNGFGRGLGIGLGENFVYIRKDLEFRIFAKAVVNPQFAIGLGEGFGHVFSYLENELQNIILQKSNENKALARGLGVGVGYVFYLSNNKKLQDRIFREIDINKALAQSLGSYLNFSWIKDYVLLQNILSKAQQNSEFAESIYMNRDFRNNTKLLNKESQDRIVDVYNHLEEKYGHNKSKFSFNDDPIMGFPSNTYYYCTNRKNEFDDQNVIDDEMKEYLQMVLDEMKKKNENDKIV